MGDEDAVLAAIAVVLLATGAVGFLWWQWRGGRGGGGVGFREWLKDPTYRAAAAAWFEARDRAAPPPDLDEATIRQMVRRLVSNPSRYSDDEFTVIVLEKAGPRIVPALLEALADPRYRRRKIGRGWMARYPVQTVLDLLAPHAPPEAVPPLAELARDGDASLRRAAIMALGEIADDACAAPLVAALDDPDEHAPSYVLIGVERALKAGRGSPAFRREMFDAILARLDRAHNDGLGGKPQTLIKLDRERAAAAMFDERFLRVENPNLMNVLRSANEAGLVVPPERLRPVIAALVPRATKYPHTWALGEALVALARTRHPDAAPLIDAALDHPDEHVSEGAGLALAVLHGCDKPMAGVYERLRLDGYESLSPEQRVALCVSEFVGEVNNGGVSQYLVNSSGSHAHHVVYTLEAIGAPRTAELARQAMAAFGVEGPAVDDGRRHHQLAAMDRAQDEALEALDNQLCRSFEAERVKSRVLRYVAAHPEHFR